MSVTPIPKHLPNGLILLTSLGIHKKAKLL